MCGGGVEICKCICINLLFVNGGKDCDSLGLDILIRECNICNCLSEKLLIYFNEF